MTYISDYLINKVFKLKNWPALTYWQKIIYKWEKENSVGMVLGYEADSSVEVEFVEVLQGQKLEQYNIKQSEAKNLFRLFKTEFKKSFPQAVPVNARFNLNWNQIYFYFYSEDRFSFWDFVPRFRKKIWYNMFLFQVWARDRVRLSDAAQYREWACGRGLCCARGRSPMPNVDWENIVLQNLEARWVENLKWHCWKLKCSLNFEKEIYEQEIENYPLKWSKFEYEWVKYICLSNNILTWETLTKEVQTWFIKRIALAKPIAKNMGCNNCGNCKI